MIERFLLYDAIDDLICVFHTNNQEGAKYLTSTSLFPNLPVSISAIQAIMESFTYQILCLPQNDHKSVYYSSFVVQLCKVARDMVPKALGAVFYTLYSALGQMDAECRARFSSWFSHHLSNFDYRWNWSEWYGR
jgi:nuclear cap-binding protein subunit 1